MNIEILNSEIIKQDQIISYFKTLTQKVFKTLTSEESMNIDFHGEKTHFIRFNQSKVRQETYVEQFETQLQYINHTTKNVIKSGAILTLNLEQDLITLGLKIDESRNIAQQIMASDSYSTLTSQGEFFESQKASTPSLQELIQEITQVFKNDDLAGLLTVGPVYKINTNSEGQFFCYLNDFFNFDFSIYDNELAVKNYYSSQKWNSEEFKALSQFTRDKLKLMKKPKVKIQRGAYRVYLEPMALAEILYSMSWSCFSEKNYRIGQNPLELLVQNKKNLSAKVTFKENFQSGYFPRFNSNGELRESSITLIENGALKQLLCSKETALKYGLTSNKAQTFESPDALEMMGGQLAKADVLQKLGTGFYLSNLHYINLSDRASARYTGMTRFACFWVENGEIVGPIEDLRFDDSIYSILGDHLEELTLERETFVNPDTYDKRGLGAITVPGALLKEFRFTL